MSDPLKPETPSQIGSVVGVDRMDELDRQKLEPLIKLQLLAAETKAMCGRDPRSGGFAIVARPRVLLQLLMDAKVSSFHSEIRLHTAMVFGTNNADLIGWWQGVPLMVRCSVIDDKLWCIALDKIPESKSVDRQKAGQIRIAAHNNALEALREGNG